MTGEGVCFSRPTGIDTISQDGFDVVVEANADELRALARHLGVDGVAAARADFTIRWRGKYQIALKGKVCATVTQTCVVTVEPFVTQIAEPIDRMYVLKQAKAGAEREIFIDPEAQDDPDVLDTKTIDLGEVTAETLALAIDPYPRKSGGRLDRRFLSSSEFPGQGPFAALKQLAGEDHGDK